MTNETTTELALSSHMFPGIAFNGMGVTFDDKQVSIEDYTETGIRLAQIARVSGFALGDWYNFGVAYYRITAGVKKPTEDQRRHDLALQAAIKATGLELQTLKNMGSVAARYQAHERISALTFTHHQEAAYVDDKKQRQELLKNAAAKNLTARALRKLIPKKATPKKSAKALRRKENQKQADRFYVAVVWLQRLTDGDLLLAFADAFDILDEAWDTIAERIAEARAQVAASAILAKENAEPKQQVAKALAKNR